MSVGRASVSRASHATFWSGLEISSKYGVQFAVTVVLARILGPSELGLMAMLVVFTAVSAVIVEGGLCSALIQKASANQIQETSVFWTNIGISILISGALWACAPTISNFYRQPRLVELLHLLVAVLPLGAIAAVPNALLAKRLAFKQRALVEVISSTVSGVLALFLAIYFRAGVWALVWQAVSWAAIRALLLLVFAEWRPRGIFKLNSVLELVPFSAFLLLSGLMNMLAARLQLLLIGHRYEPRTLGIYSVALNTQQAPLQFMTNLLNRVGLPMFSIAATEPEQVPGVFGKSLRLSLFFFVPFMFWLALSSEPIVKLLYGNEWLRVAPILSVLCIACSIWPLHVLNLVATTSMGRSDILLKLEVYKSIITVSLTILAIPFGILVLAWSVLVTNLSFVFLNTWYSKRLLGYGLRKQLKDLMPIVVLAAVATFAAYFFRSSSDIAYWNLVLTFVIGALVYIGGAFAFQLESFREVWRLLEGAFRAVSRKFRVVSR
ncbi:lipopolysaccharide biosynthesis protein [Lysobacter sp. HDW10]|uniref:lipopolysaccharide biosynthesis protein n=1 Tax=Lysobacter sp. HDW10 TaxID=2714936 RepID=UPI001F116C21|nr:lipopolysaccharide biosynthesis protein [Lysobacter sp. HDW10]